MESTRVVHELRELNDLTADANGAQRVSWTPTWAKARDWLKSLLEELPVTIESDEAGNLWATLPGKSERAIVIGSHIDSVENGGWLDGSLGILAGVAILRRIVGEGTPPMTVRLVDWADEEGARFGRCLFGSSCASGNIDMAQVGQLTDDEGITLAAAAAEYGVDLNRAKHCKRQLANADGYIELHVESGVVLEELGLPVGVMTSMCAVERNIVRFTGRAAHESFPWDLRSDAFAAAARFALAVREIARASGGMCNVGKVVCRPGYPTAAISDCEIVFDERHFEGDVLGEMMEETRSRCDAITAEEGVEVEWELLWQVPPTRFDPELIDWADSAVLEVVGRSHRLGSPPNHDATEMVRAGVPSIMLMIQSIGGIGHAKEEDSHPEHIEFGVRALDQLATKIMQWAVSHPPAMKGV